LTGRAAAWSPTAWIARGRRRGLARGRRRLGSCVADGSRGIDDAFVGRWLARDRRRLRRPLTGRPRSR
jgi:hypothetical protein